MYKYRHTFDKTNEAEHAKTNAILFRISYSVCIKENIKKTSYLYINLSSFTKEDNQNDANTQYNDLPIILLIKMNNAFHKTNILLTNHTCSNYIRSENNKICFIVSANICIEQSFMDIQVA